MFSISNVPTNNKIYVLEKYYICIYNINNGIINVEKNFFV